MISSTRFDGNSVEARQLGWKARVRVGRGLKLRQQSSSCGQGKSLCRKTQGRGLLIFWLFAMRVAARVIVAV